MKIPGHIIIDLIKNMVVCPNVFQPKIGVSETLIIHSIMMGMAFNYTKHCHVYFCKYAQTYEYPKYSNNLTPSIC